MSPDQPTEQPAIPRAPERIKAHPAGSGSLFEEKHGAADQNEQPATQNELREFEKASLRLARRTLTATWVIAGVTGVYALVAFLQWRAMTGQLNSMNESGKDTRALASAAGNQAEQMRTLAEQTKALAEQTKSLADSGKMAADAAEISAANSSRSVESARDALRLDQRAWVNVVGFGGTPAAGDINVVVEYRNTGKTPARDVHAAMNVIVCPIDPEPPMPDYRTAHFVKGRESKSAILAPNTSLSLHGTGYDITDNARPLTNADVNDINQHKLSIFARGRIMYTDVFDVGHWVTFCYRWDAFTRGYTPCLHGNAIDTQERMQPPTRGTEKRPFER